jgi:hypothetical protein
MACCFLSAHRLQENIFSAADLQISNHMQDTQAWPGS